MGVVPRLRLGSKKAKGGVESTGPHKVKFTEEPTVVLKKNDKGEGVKNLRFVVEENGIQLCWYVPLLNSESQPHYLIERLIDIKVGSERTLQMIKDRGRNYISVSSGDEAPEDPENPGSDLPY